MILDIRYRKYSPEQIQNVRMATVYTKKQGDAKPEIVIHLQNLASGQMNINLKDIESITITND